MAPSPRLRSGYVPAGRIVLHDVRGGRGSPPVVFVHGVGDSGVLEWRYVLPTVAQRRRILAPDLPGFGFSQKPPARYGVPLFERTLVRYLDARRLRRVVLVGASLGGRVALELALRHPERVERLILVDALGFGRPRAPLLGAFAVPVVGDLAYGGLAGALLSMENDRFRSLVGRFGRSPDAFDDSRLEILRQIHADPGAAHSHTQTVRSLLLHSGDDLSEALSSAHLPMPVRLIWGADDRVFPLQLAVRAQSLLSSAKLAVIEGAGHTPQVDRPDAFLQALLSSLTD